MYDERKERFTLKDVIIQVLFVGVFVFLLMWLFPMKSDVKKALSPLYDQIFNQNVTSMKEAAISYYTTPRLPKNIGDEEKMTLAEMLASNIVLPFVDRKGNQCDLYGSYVSITKMNEEYILKVNLKCGDQEDYLLVHLGCYNYCDNGICEKQDDPVVEQPVIDNNKPSTPTNPTNPSKPDPKPDEKPDPQPVVKDEYLYEYVKITNGKWGEYSGWSDWTTNVITQTDYRAVETKTETEKTYKIDKVTTYEPVYGTKRVQTGTKQVQTGTKTETYTEKELVTKTRQVPVYTTQKIPKTEPVYKNTTVENCKTVNVPKEQKQTQYKNIKVGTSFKKVCNDTCKMEQVPVYERVPYTTTTTVMVAEKQCTQSTEKIRVGTKTVYETKEIQTGTKTEQYQEYETVTKTRQVPVYSQVPVYNTITVQTGVKPVTKEVKTPVETKVTYYRSRTREYISGSVDTKWSKSQNDNSLLSQGYTLTGNSKKA